MSPSPPRACVLSRPGAGGKSLVEFDLKDISYTVKSPTCHELAAAGCAEEPMVLTFEEEREAQKWWTVVSSSLREVQKAAETTGILAAQPPPLSSVIGSPAAAPEEEASLELSKTEDLALRLSLAIEVGNEQAASQCAMALARQQASLRIQPKESSHPTNEISMKVCVEDATCSANITLRVHTHMTVATLKQQVFQDYKFHPSVQRWIIGQCLCVDERTVSSYGIRKDGDTAFLYLLSVKQAGLSEQRFQEDLTQAQAALRPAASLTDSAGVDDKRRCSTLPAAAPRKVWVSDSGRKMNIDEISNHLNLLQVNNLLYNHPLGALATAAPPSPVQTGWSCPKCTFINKPTRPGCEMCSADRPPGYVVPGGYTPDEMELWRMQQEKDGIRQYQQEKGRRDDGPAVPRTLSTGSLDDFIHLSSEYC
ncbi:ranBP-type and C3HC4-type zinc finger-containing protein 1-like [Alligator mississippiensis]|uniref:RanBP-type and C3HC4-type zinc finger-containing protein 1-like n=1 Tax=Alligator mississippiensis TaxID=8496 RepID=A0A151N7T5_ALLMI|nr:ranBP-type and C3HC4-type zinc finger-containing protein 1-like [Alligator mississippiensis]